MPRPARNSPTPTQAKQLAQLQARIAAFRKNHPPRARIPDALRDAVLEIVADGVSPAQVLGTCKISSSVLHRWRHESTVATKPPSQRVSILSVVGPEPAPFAAPAHHAELQFRIGDWNLHIRVEPRAK